MTNNKDNIKLKDLNIDFTGIDRSIGWIKLRAILDSRFTNIISSEKEIAPLVSRITHQILEKSSNASDVRHILDILQSIDWEVIIEDRDKRRDKLLCVMCNSLTEFNSTTYVYAGYWSKPGNHCQKCVDKLKKQHSRQCIFRLSPYYPDRKGTLSGTCDMCYGYLSPEKRKTADKIGDYILQTGGELNLSEWFDTLDYFEYMCAYCLQNDYEHLDHFIPRIYGGVTSKSNCLPACRFCNTKKGSRDPRRYDLHEFPGIERIRYFTSLYSKPEG